MTKYEVQAGHEYTDDNGVVVPAGEVVELDPLAERTQALVTNGYVKVFVEKSEESSEETSEEKVEEKPEEAESTEASTEAEKTEETESSEETA